MKKKTYISPAVETTQYLDDSPLLAGSITGTSTDGLGDDNLDFQNVGDDPANAWSRIIFGTQF